MGTVVNNYLIGIREGLEAALVVGILVAYLVRSGRRDLLPKVWAGVGIAAAASLAIGAGLTYGPRGLSFAATETIGGVLSIATVGLVTWMIFWMAKTSRSMRGALEGALDKAIALGGGAVLVIALLAVGREGLETALFIWAGVNAAGATATPLVGALLGITTSLVLGWAIYRGAVTVNLRSFFQWTGVFLILVAAGVLAHGIHELQEAGLVPGAEALAFDISGAIPPSSWYGTLLKGVFNFSPTTTIIEASAWLLYAIPTLIAFTRVAFGGTARSRSASTLAGGSLVGVAPQR